MAATEHAPHHQHGGMGQRGVTRGGHDMHGMSPDERRHMMQMHHQKTLWVWWLIVLLGLWLLASPLTFDYARGAATPAGDRWLPFALETRVSVLFWNDLACGALLALLGWRLLTPGRPITQWAACFVGIWLQFAPLIFWAPTPLVYLNETLVGAFVIALTILIPGMPGMMMIMQPGPDVPPGWSYNPSSWPQRWVMIGLAFAGWLVSRYLAAFQLGYVDHAWDPFFGASTRTVLTSDVSRMLPISDAGLGAAAYTFEFLMGWMGSPARWRTMPWMVLFFGILVVPLGLTHIVLVMLQPVIVTEWCSLCLLAALIMLPMIPLTLDEVVAMCQFMYARVAVAGDPFWRTFWFGGTIEGGEPDERSPELQALPKQPGGVVAASLWGFSVPWTLAVAAALGIWLMFAPTVFGTSGTAADSAHLTGALIFTVAVIAMGEVARTFRLVNVLLGLWLVVGPWFLADATLWAKLNALAVGVAVGLLSVPRGKILERYGGWDAYLY